jgi:hypothetical protein
MQFDWILEDRQVPDLTFDNIVYSRNCSPAAATAPLLPRLQLQVNNAPANASTVFQVFILDVVPYPASQPGNRLVAGHRLDPLVALLLATSRYQGATGDPIYSPEMGDEPFFTPLVRR